MRSAVHATLLGDLAEPAARRSIVHRGEIESTGEMTFVWEPLDIATVVVAEDRLKLYSNNTLKIQALASSLLSFPPCPLRTTPAGPFRNSDAVKVKPMFALVSYRQLSWLELL